MSTMTQTRRTGQPGIPASRTRLVSGRLAVALMSSFGALTSFYLLLSVTPMYAVSAGAGSAAAGLVTGSLMLATVLAEFASARLMGRYGYRAVFAAGALLLGGPALALLAPRSMVMIVAVSIARGIGFGLNTGVAALGLFAQAVTATAGRWWAGRHGDRHGHAGLLIPGLLTAAAGMTALIWVASPAAVIAGMCLFGTGFGISQNVTFALMIDRAPVSGYGTASAMWNLAYDAGYGAGPAVFGVFVAHTGYPAAFALTALLILTALMPAVRDRGHLRPPGAAGHRRVGHMPREVLVPARHPAGRYREMPGRKYPEIRRRPMWRHWP
jgi:MFS family permease